jgi:hypothetical protein
MEGMTPQEKAAVMQFMGQTYGQAHKQDQMMVSESGNLKPTADRARQVFEQTAKIPTIQSSLPVQAQAVPEGVSEPIQQVSPEQAAQEITAQQIIRTEQPQVVEEVDTNQVEFDFSEPTKIDQLIDLIKDQNLILEDIRLKLSDGKNAKSKK